MPVSEPAHLDQVSAYAVRVWRCVGREHALQSHGGGGGGCWGGGCAQGEFSQTLLRAGADASACFQKLRAIPPACMHRDRLVFDDDLKETCCGQLEQLVQAQCHCGPELQTAMLEWDLDLSQFARVRPQEGGRLRLCTSPTLLPGIGFQK